MARMIRPLARRPGRPPVKSRVRSAGKRKKRAAKKRLVKQGDYSARVGGILRGLQGY